MRRNRWPAAIAADRFRSTAATGTGRVASKADIDEQHGSLSEEQRKLVAARLDTEVSELGG